MYLCPYCHTSLSKWAVWSAGPLGTRRCPSCESAYFGGGLAEAMALLCASAYVGILLSALTGKPLLVWLLPLAGVLVGTWYMVRAQPKPREQRWLEVIKMFVAPLVLWVVLQVTSVLAGAYAKW